MRYAHCSKSMPKTPKQESEPEPIYETIMDFKDNVAYGIVQSPTSVWLLVRTVCYCFFFLLLLFCSVCLIYTCCHYQKVCICSVSNVNTCLYIITLSSLWMHDGHSLPSLALSIVVRNSTVSYKFVNLWICEFVHVSILGLCLGDRWSIQKVPRYHNNRTIGRCLLK